MNKFNINNIVKVKITDRGVELLAFYYLGRQIDAVPLKIDENGYSEFQLWELFKIFGEHIHAGCVLPFETEILI